MTTATTIAILHKERSLLFSGATVNQTDSTEQHASNGFGLQRMTTVADETRSVAASLMRTKAMMKQELGRISDVTHTIDRDGKLLQETSAEHKGLSSVVKNARWTLRVLKRQDLQETAVLWCSVFLFYLVVFYIVWTRIRIPFLFW